MTAQALCGMAATTAMIAVVIGFMRRSGLAVVRVLDELPERIERERRRREILDAWRR